MESIGPIQEHPAEEWPKIFAYLEYVEFGLASVIALCAVGLAIYLALWIFFGCGADIHARLVQTLKGMNTAWRISLLVLVPLFFRPIFKFLFYLRKGPLGTASDVLASMGTIKPDKYEGSAGTPPK